jgi:hypothetical protein
MKRTKKKSDNLKSSMYPTNGLTIKVKWDLINQGYTTYKDLEKDFINSKGLEKGKYLSLKSDDDLANFYFHYLSDFKDSCETIAIKSISKTNINKQIKILVFSNIKRIIKNYIEVYKKYG